MKNISDSVNMILTTEMIIENKYRANQEIKEKVLDLVKDYYHFSDEIRSEFYYIIQDIVSK